MARSLEYRAGRWEHRAGSEERRAGRVGLKAEARSERKRE